jgi:Cu+-exporting ATPase
MKRIIAVIAITVSVAAGSLGCGTVTAHPSDAARESAHAPIVYACPMHPDQHSNHPGDCPICGMHMEPQRGSADAAASTQAPDQSAR